MSRRVGIRTISQIFGRGVVELEEGNYSDWTIYDSFDDHDDIYDRASSQGAVINRKETQILLAYSTSLKLKRYTIESKTLTELTGVYLSPFYYGNDAAMPYSAYGTYFVAMIFYSGSSGDGIVVVKDGVIVKTLTYSDLGLDSGTVYSVDISPTGKYIVVSGTRTATGKRGWVILVGS